ncbi:glycosyltransferase family 4 protein [Planococcus sp. N064]|uniref:Glycosyltransferase family 4 protein n=1 Tax=Planococcus liqunii TaxID=3058394 RepID=A0ABT8MN42_9BACL|nr:glycosyltransferase family 4 protein [Planococcus sp. N064]MDN7226317.1 glycosyltransferase family 4 protein [Planococcus sp. N064]
MGAKVIQAVTVSESLVFMAGQISHLQNNGYEVKTLSSDGKYIDRFKKMEDVPMLLVDMEREISLFKDFKALLKCIGVIRRERPDIVNASTPKAGLIVTLAAYLCRVPIRIYTMRGLRLETTKGLKRKVLIAAEKVAVASATHCLAVSESLKAQVTELEIAPREKISVLGKGSGEGFELSKFRVTEKSEINIQCIRESYGLSSEHTVLGFVGRMTKDKGIAELVDIFLKLHKTQPKLRLLIIGEYEDADPVEEMVKQEIHDNPAIFHTGYQADPIPFFHIMDVFVFLTKREGFGNVAIEAALSRTPVIVSNVTGAKDTVIDGETGFLVNPENPQDMLEKLELLVLAPELRQKMGERAEQWAIENFSNETLWNELDRYYQECLIGNMKAVEQTH